MQKYLVNLLPYREFRIAFEIALGLILPCIASAQIRTDGSVGPAAQTLAGPRFVIPESLGKLSGNNLFHSFQTFNINSQESANFTTSTSGLANVISRVSGGSLSQINGKLSLTAASGTPGFYFINPAGVTFGAGAVIDVPGAFHVSTANHLKFADGNFYADPKTASTFSSGAPEAFGFLGTGRAAIVVRDKAVLGMRAGQSISLVAGDIEVNNGTVQTTGGGSIRVAALGTDAKDIPFAGSLPALHGNLATLNGGAIVSNTGATQDGGSMVVSAGDIVIDGRGPKTDLTGIISTSDVGSVGKVGGIDVAASGNLSIFDGGALASNTNASGNSGPVKVSAKNLVIDSKGNTTLYTALASTAFEGTGNAGAVDVSVLESLKLVNGGVIASPTFSKGNAGSVKVTAGNIVIDGQGNEQLVTGISSAALQGSTGKAGSMDVTSLGNLSIVNGGSIESPTFSSGNAGSIKVTAGNIVIDGQGNSAGITSAAIPGSGGKAGSVEVISLGKLSIINGGIIDSSTLSNGDAGSVKVTAGSVSINGQGNGAAITSVAGPGSNGRAGSVEVTATGGLSIVNGAISSSTLSVGDAGSVKVTAGSIHIDQQGRETSIASVAGQGSKGKAGSVEVAASGNLSITNGGAIKSSTESIGDAGSIRISAGSITIDGQGRSTGITSEATSESGGKAGSVEVIASGKLSLLNGGFIDSSTSSIGDAGSVKVTAGNISIDGQGNSAGITSVTGGKGHAGSVDVATSGELSIINGGVISSSTLSVGDAGSIKITAGSLRIDGQGNLAGIASIAGQGSSGKAGSVEVAASGELSIVNGGIISSSTESIGDAGSLRISAGSITIDGGGKSSRITSAAAAGSKGKAGSVEVSSLGKLSLVNGGFIDSSTFSIGDAGSVKVTAGNISIDGRGNSAGITTVAGLGSRGKAGSVEVTASTDLSIISGGTINSSTGAKGDAGSVRVTAGSISIDGQGEDTGISSAALAGSTGKAGSLDVTASGKLSIVNNGTIDSSTSSIGDAGSIRVNAGTIAIDGRGNGFSTGVTSAAKFGSTGKAGSVEVTAAGALTLLNRGFIDSSTESFGDAGQVKVTAGSLTIDGQNKSAGITSRSELSATGKGGNVDVRVLGNLSILNGGIISSDSLSNGNAGSVLVNATGNILMANGGQIESSSLLGSGNAGNVTVTALEDLTILDSRIDSSTFGDGAAGTVRVNARNILASGDNPLLISGISASAFGESAGQTGSVIVTATDSVTLSNGGKIAIQNFANVRKPASLVPTLLTVTAPNITLNPSQTSNTSQITAASTGNVAASNIEINFTEKLTLNSSRITTSANAGNGGSIRIQGGDVIALNESQITTSVASTSNGNGGDINLRSNALAMQTGFIQANTAAVNATGGNVLVDVKALVPSGTTLFVGGNTPLAFIAPGVPGFNVIQAAAPTGVGGNVRISSPALNITGSLIELKYQILDTGGLGRSPCRVARDSSLTQVGRGGFAPSARNLLGPRLVADGEHAGLRVPVAGQATGFFTGFGCGRG